MTQRVKVHSCNDDGTAQVIHIRPSACSSDCHQCAGCGAARETLIFTADNPIGAQPGQVVTVTAATKPVLASAAVLYIMPVVLFFLGYLLGLAWWQTGAIPGGICFVLGIGGCVAYDRLVVKKQNTIYTITGFEPEENVQANKGEHNLD